jgi:hypothetical protein
MQKTSLSFFEISRRLRALPLPEVDLVLGIATGGTVPASLVAHQLGCDMLLVHVNYRDEHNVPRYSDPVLFTLPPLPESRRRHPAGGRRVGVGQNDGRRAAVAGGSRRDYAW